MPTRLQVNNQRAINTEYQKIFKTLLDMAVEVNLTYARYESSGRKRLLERLIASLNKLLSIIFGEMEASAINISSASIVGKLTKNSIKKELSKWQGPVGTLSEMHAKSRRDIIDSITSQYNKLVSEGASVEQVRRALIGTKFSRYSDGALSRLMNQKGLFQTTAKMSITASNQKLWRDDPKVIGYMWSSVLDGRTSTTCMSLNGKQFFYKNSGYQPHPPIHFNCRSSEVPIEKGKDLPNIETLSSFLRSNTDEAIEALGPVRYKLFRDGKLKINRFNDAFFRPLSLDELEKRNKVAFERAGI